MKIPGSILIAGIVVLLISSPSASAKDNDIVLLQGDVVKLQQTVQKLQDAVDAKNAAMISQMEKIADSVNNISLNMQKMSDQLNTLHTDNTAANAAPSRIPSTTTGKNCTSPTRPKSNALPVSS